MRFITVVVCISLCLLMLTGVLCSSSRAAESTDPFTDLQNQVLALRNQYKLYMQKTEQDHLAIQETVKAKLEEFATTQQANLSAYAELKKALTPLETAMTRYNTDITDIETTVNAIETQLTTQFDEIETRLKTIHAQALTQGSGKSEGKEAPTLEQLEIPAGQLFRAAYKFFTEGDYDTAIAGFQKYLTDYPNTELEGAAHYWIAESFAKLQEYETALAEYDTLIQKYPQNEKLADAYYGKGVVLLQIGRTEDARTALMYVRDHFSNTISGRKAITRLQEIQ